MNIFFYFGFIAITKNYSIKLGQREREEVMLQSKCLLQSFGGIKDVKVTNTENYAAGFCNKYSRTNANGKGLTAGRWWLPSMGEMAMIWANFDKINYALSKISGATQLQANWYWTSTQGSASNAWTLLLGAGGVDNHWKFNQRWVRPVSAFLY